MIDINKEPYAQRCFKAGFKEGFKESLIESFEKGRLKGSREEMLNSLIIVLEARFAPLDVKHKQMLLNFDELALYLLLRRSVSVENLQGFFADFDNESDLIEAMIDSQADIEAERFVKEGRLQLE